MEKDTEQDLAIYKNEIYYYIILKYYFKKLGKKNFNNFIIKGIKKEIGKNIENKEDLEKSKNLEEVKEVLFGDAEENFEEIEKLLDVLDMGKEFRERTSSNISFNNNILNIEKYGIEISLNDETNLTHTLTLTYCKPLIELLNREDEDKFLSKDELFILLTNIYTYDRENLTELVDEDYESKKGYYTKEKSKMKKVMDMFNEAVKNKLKENKRTEKEFFILGKKEDKILEINEEFYKIETDKK